MDYVKLHRQILDWEWYGEINTSRLFIHILLKANWKDGKFKGIDIPRGSFVSSVQKLSEETGLSVRKVRTAISHLEKTGEVTSKAYSKFTVFTINNYIEYQTSDKQPTSKRQTDDKQSTTIEEKKEIKNIKKEDPKGSKKKIFEPPSVDDVRAYCQERKNSVDPQKFVDFYASKGWMIGKNHMKDWKAAVRTWEKAERRAPEQQENKINKGMMRSNYGDMSELEKQLLSN